MTCETKENQPGSWISYVFDTNEGQCERRKFRAFRDAANEFKNRLPAKYKGALRCFQSLFPDSTAWLAPMKYYNQTGYSVLKKYDERKGTGLSLVPSDIQGLV